MPREYKLDKNGIRILDDHRNGRRENPKCLPGEHKWVNAGTRPVVANQHQDLGALVRVVKCAYCGDEDTEAA